LNGAIEFAWFDQNPDGWGIPRGAIVNGVMLLTNAFFMLLFYKEFKITAFDPALAKSQGINPGLMHYLLMTMTAATAVAAFETVGSILVVAMFIVPPATAYILTDRYGVLVGLSLGIGALAAALGHLSAITVPTWFGFSGTTTAGAMAVAAGALFVLAWMFSPSQGLLIRLLHNRRTQAHILAEDVLGFLWRVEERSQGNVQEKDLHEALGTTSSAIKRIVRHLLKHGAIARNDSHYVLTKSGQTRATSLVRSHRLWEVYLEKHFPQDSHQLHQSASRLEHVTTEEMQSHLGDADTDPHGMPVPSDENI
jgi:manganese/zinc/iron transport system permease protein